MLASPLHINSLLFCDIKVTETTNLRILGVKLTKT